jgi:hypothetical protein
LSMENNHETRSPMNNNQGESTIMITRLYCLFSATRL